MAFYIFPEVLSKQECNKYLAYCLLNSTFKPASTIKSGTPDTVPWDIQKEDEGKRDDQIYDDELRKTDVTFISDRENLMNELVWGFIREANNRFFNYKLDYFQAIQFARYQNGGHYDWHQDSTGNDDEGKIKEYRKLSLTMSLTDHNDYDGGLLQFYNGDKPYVEKDVANDVKKQGSVIVFDSRDWHRVTPVTKGVRYSIVCWTVGPNFI